jgi:hypothetical protein
MGLALAANGNALDVVHLPLWVPLIASPSSLVNGTNKTRLP